MSNYECNGEWSGYTIWESAKGWIVETWSRVQGTLNGRMVLLPYSEDFPRGLDLDRYGEALAYRAANGALILRCGRVVT